MVDIEQAINEGHMHPLTFFQVTELIYALLLMGCSLSNRYSSSASPKDFSKTKHRLFSLPAQQVDLLTILVPQTTS